MDIKFDASKLQRLNDWLASIPRGAINVVMPAVTDYIKGSQPEGGPGAGGVAGEFHGLTLYPPFRAWPGGQQEPMRTGRLQRGWKTVSAPPYKWSIQNNVPYAGWVMGNTTQTWRAKYGNWRTVAQVVSDNLLGAIRYAKSKLAIWLKGQ